MVTARFDAGLPIGVHSRPNLRYQGPGSAFQRHQPSANWKTSDLERVRAERLSRHAIIAPAHTMIVPALAAGTHEDAAGMTIMRKPRTSSSIEAISDAGRKADVRDSPWLVAALGGILLFSIVLGAGDATIKNKLQDLLGYGGRQSDDPGDSRDLFRSRVPIGGIRDEMTYGDFDVRRDREASTAFYGFGCLSSCEGAASGFRWAARHDIGDPSECLGLSWDFLEGCAPYALRPREEQ